MKQVIKKKKDVGMTLSPKTNNTRRPCKVGLRVCNNLPQPPLYISFLGGCGRLLHTVGPTLQGLLVLLGFGTVSSLNDFYTCIQGGYCPFVIHDDIL